MSKTQMGMLVLVVLFLAILLAVALWPQVAASRKSFGECLTEQGVEMYGVDWCPNCQNQKKLFGEDFSNVAYTNCDFQKELCREKGVRVYPVWARDDDVLIGFQSFENLAELSGCPLPS